MLVIRVVLIAGALFLLGIGVAFLVTRDRKYLRLAWRVAQWVLVLLVAAGLVYVFSRVLLL
ncbi:hypothetical protein DSM104443_00692 [Usitatibacter rugosus]|uniref:Uncharacterized protein n=1 Tax=Usitatibacter rugosus TaxID=2732067 RepID=A0A6M4GTL0_9PROT|nr:hypothetical protein [Usitatibacter rugosus]QJR09643.1 hypothetical protein DSM104443_00692 [Usitatibacter rugosus]